MAWKRRSRADAWAGGWEWQEGHWQLAGYYTWLAGSKDMTEHAFKPSVFSCLLRLLSPAQPDSQASLASNISALLCLALYKTWLPFPSSS